MHLLMQFTLLGIMLISPVWSGNMNPGNYYIANSYPGYEIGNYRGEYFEVYSNVIDTQYSEVYWRVQDAIPLPSDIVSRFNGKTMAITGYEVDIIRKTANGDVSVPSYEEYNHHYIAYLSNNQSTTMSITNRDTSKPDTHGHIGVQWATTIDNGEGKVSDSNIPLTTVFSEGNGGEMRLSFHGYAETYAQLLDSPTSFIIQPMMINTKDPNGGRGGPLPNSNNIWPANAPASGLVECPCTTRVTKVPSPPSTSSSGLCSSPFADSASCFNAAGQLGFKGSNQTISDPSSPPSCFVTVTDKTIISFNSYLNSTFECGTGSKLANASGKAYSINTLQLDLNGAADLATITISGQDGVWFGVGFNASLMADEPYAIIVDGYGAVTERKLAEHDPGVQLAPSVTVVSNNVLSGIRTVVVTRPLEGKDADYYTFSLQISSINFINAVGDTPDLEYHFNRTGDVINLVVSGVDQCICQGVGGAVGGLPFGENCLPEPKSDLLAQNNTSCFFETFNGGLQCCFDGDFLLDANQTIPPAVDEYYMKYRFYFEDYQPDYHQPLFRLYWQTEATQGEYDIPQCPKGTPPQECIHTITSHFTLQDMMSNCSIRTDPWCADSTQITKGVNLIYAGGHCHAPMCIDMELYDETTGSLLCRNVAQYGTSDAAMDESGYVVQIPPCIWGTEAEGLPPPPLLQLNTPLLSIKRANNTSPHYGDMASWQMRGAYAT